MLSFTAEATGSTGLVTVTAVDNAAEDGDKSVTVSGAVSDTAVAVAPEDRTLAITDDEGLPQVTLVLTPETVTEADDPATTEKNESVSVVTATLQKAHEAAFTVTVAAAGVSPADADDFTVSWQHGADVRGRGHREHRPGDGDGGGRRAWTRWTSK